MKNVKKHKFEALDAIRGLAAIIVMTAHFLQFTGRDPLFNCSAAVDLFYMLSGFVLIHNYGARLEQEMSMADYLRRRIVRLYPMMMLGLALGLIGCMMMTPHVSYKFLVQSFFTNSLFLPDLNGYAITHYKETLTGTIVPVDFPLWSLCFEMLASVLFIGLCRMTNMRLGIVSAVSLVLLAGLTFTCYNGDQPGWIAENVFGGVPRVLYGFSLGIILYRLHERLTARFAGHALTRHSAALYIFIALPLFLPLNIKGLYHYGLIVAWAPLAVLWGSAILPRFKADAYIAKLMGRLSYPLYCVHVPVFRLLSLILAPLHLNDAVMIVTAAAVSFFFAFAALVWYDEPLRRFVNGLFLGYGARRSAKLQNNLNKSFSVGN
jgi:peptidoglycan/LPS O-acetylase OafA/YrhL